MVRPVQTVEVKSTRLAHLDGMRGFACLQVLVTHSLQEVFWPGWPGGWLSSIFPFLFAARYSVLLFIALSGYCLMLPVVTTGGLRRGVRGFYAGRIRRIVPAYYAAITLALVLIGSGLWSFDGRMDDISLGVSVRAIIAKVFFVHNLWPPPFFAEFGNVAIVAPLWTIAVEAQIYLVFPAMLALRWCFGDRIAFGTVIVLGWVAYVVISGAGTSQAICLPGFFPHFYGMFAVGALAAASRADEPARTRWPLWSGLGLVGFVVLLYGRFRYDFVLQAPLEAYCFPWFYSVFRACEHPGVWQRFFNWRPLAAVGNFSYSLYLLHLPMLAMLSRYVLPALVSPTRRNPGAYLILLGVAVATILPTAWVFAQIFEFPHVRKAVAKRLGRGIAIAVGRPSDHVRQQRVSR